MGKSTISTGPFSSSQTVNVYQDKMEVIPPHLGGFDSLAAPQAVFFVPMLLCVQCNNVYNSDYNHIIKYTYEILNDLILYCVMLCYILYYIVYHII